MRLHLIDTGYFKLDGGAMFGVVPQTIWKKLNPPDANNMCSWAMRSLLVEENNALTLIDTGIGNKQSEKFFSYYHLHGENSLDSSLSKAGFQASEITDVFLTHLHFDHVGGAVSREEDKLLPTFKNAEYWTHEAHWQSATAPNPRESASFLQENIFPLQQSGQLQYLTGNYYKYFDYLVADGHTEKMMLPILNYKNRKLVFVSDMIPSVGHLPLPYVMAYDIRPLISMEEKKQFLKNAASEKWILIFQHDPVNECCTVKFSEKGVVVDELFRLSDLS